jgi:hypothetical protein
MPKFKIITTNFSSGELSPWAMGRVDIARYANSAKRLENVICRAIGGISKRSGTQFLGSSIDQGTVSRLVPFVVNRNLGYMLVFGNNTMTVFRQDGTRVTNSDGTPYTIATPYTAAMLPEIDWAPAEKEVFFFHGSVAPYRLRCFGEALWDFSQVPFTTEPFEAVGDYPAVNLTIADNTAGTGKTITADSSYFLAADVGRAILLDAGTAVITAVASGTSITANIIVPFNSSTLASGTWNLDSSPQATMTISDGTPVGVIGTLTLSSAGWRSGDVGKYVRVNGGLFQIQTITSSTVAQGKLLVLLTSTATAPPLAWTLESKVWGGVNGYPQTGCMYQQRLVVGGMPGRPQTVFGSRSGEPYDFTKGADDDLSFTFTLNTSQEKSGPINSIVSTRDLLVLTDGAEISIRGGTDKALTPTNVNIKNESPNGSIRVRPTQVGKETLYVKRAAQKIIAIGYRYDEDAYKSIDVSTLAEGIIESGVHEMALAQEKDPILWVVLEDGRLVTMTIDRDLDIVAWSRQATQGVFESVAALPVGSQDQVWFITRREVDGVERRYVERLEPLWWPKHGEPASANPGYSWGFTLDCAKQYDSDGGLQELTGLSHLEGLTVSCLADGVDLGEFTVTGGAIQLPRVAYRVLVGLKYSPIVELLTPEIQGAEGSVQADAMSINRVSVRMHESIGCLVEGAQALPGRKMDTSILDQNPKTYSGWATIETIGWKNMDGGVTISQETPMPFNLLSVVREMTFNGG